MTERGPDPSLSSGESPALSRSRALRCPAYGPRAAAESSKRPGLVERNDCRGPQPDISGARTAAGIGRMILRGSSRIHRLVLHTFQVFPIVGHAGPRVAQ